MFSYQKQSHSYERMFFELFHSSEELWRCWAQVSRIAQHSELSSHLLSNSPYLLCFVPACAVLTRAWVQAHPLFHAAVFHYKAAKTQ